MLTSTTRPYCVYAMTLDAARTVPWRWDEWRRVVPALDALFADKATAVRSFQNDDSKNRPSKIRGETVLGGTVKFGALRWNEPSHQKWTHASPRTALESDAWRFFSTDFARPSLRSFDRSRVPPDVYGRLIGSRTLQAPDGKVVVTPASFFVAVALDVPLASLAEIAMREAAGAWTPRCLARRRRTWAVDASEVLALRPGLAVASSMQDSAFAPSADVAEAEGWEILVSP